MQWRDIQFSVCVNCSTHCPTNVFGASSKYDRASRLFQQETEHREASAVDNYLDVEDPESSQTYNLTFVGTKFLTISSYQRAG